MNKELRIKQDTGTLFIIATPIGNLNDITLRALEVLQSVDLIACEDTRVTGKLLAHFNIKKPMVSYFQHSKLSKIEYIIEQLLSGKNIALVTDAGTPGISDPGEPLVRMVREISNFQFLPCRQAGLISNECPNDLISNYLSNLDLDIKELIKNLELKIKNSAPIKVLPVPGASALTAVASVSGMIEKEFYFAGFLPKKKGRQTAIKKILSFDVPAVIYESANRLEKLLGEIREFGGEHIEVFIAREMTKMFEEYWGGGIMEVIDTLDKHQLKGEIVLIVKKKEKLNTQRKGLL